MSNVENYSTDLVCGKNRNDLREILLRNGAPFFSANIADRVSHTSAVDTTAHSIWRGKERRRMPTNPVSTSPVHTAPPLPSSFLVPVYRGFCDPTPTVPTSLLLHIPNLRSGGGRKRCAIDRHRLKHRTLSPSERLCLDEGRLVRVVRSKEGYQSDYPGGEIFFFQIFVSCQFIIIVLFSLGRVSYSDLDRDDTRGGGGVMNNAPDNRISVMELVLYILQSK